MSSTAHGYGNMSLGVIASSDKIYAENLAESTGIALHLLWLGNTRDDGNP
jgi:hypothetical protein